MLRSFQNLPGAEPCAAGEHRLSTILWLTLISSGFLSIHLSAHLLFCTSPISALCVLLLCSTVLPKCLMLTLGQELSTNRGTGFRLRALVQDAEGIHCSGRAVVVKVVAEVAFSLKPA